jgi:hypothetical protein
MKCLNQIRNTVEIPFLLQKETSRLIRDPLAQPLLKKQTGPLRTDDESFRSRTTPSYFSLPLNTKLQSESTEELSPNVECRLKAWARLSIYRKDDDYWYNGEIKSFVKYDKIQILYEDGVKDVICLEDEKWSTLSTMNHKKKARLSQTLPNTHKVVGMVSAVKELL